ncbi:hypothetical protein SAMN05444287_1352 [Octadecabacter temperatus]|uniref:Uncharacterized protein n=1 Tax=Octadecabacter temperatus TaxID=1458307 RepID=A0A0K0Y5K0_9RHOB|nr:hypothetical protein [Octadecabacter temperatus]AKS46243.1 hypothetical protein OSB_16950 [Octadecabacter temperatus]SIO10395.1 hypothetical protein SAMN05444287_1352 [Octadecabacter temperatus]
MPKSKKSKRSQSTQVPQKVPLTRRTVLQSLALYGTGTAVAAGGGALFALDFRSKLAEADLTRIGTGTPAIVQIHDPSCQLCLALQRETRAALNDCDEQYIYLVANIKSEIGAAFQRRMGQPHVTLALLDADGTPLHFINGVTPADTLKDAFQTHFG